jgi:hypothetical protein
MPMLTWERRDGQRMVFHLQSMETAIGRDLGNAIRLDSGYVSKRHAVVRLGQQGYTITDLNSSNGTLVNGQRVGLAMLKDGDRIELGAEVLVFSNPADPLAAPVPAAGAPRKPLLWIIVGAGLLIVLGLVGLIVLGSGTPQPGPAAGTPAGAPTGPVAPPQDFGAGARPGAAATAPLPDEAAVPLEPVSQEPLPSNDPVALYEMALAHVKGDRLVEARRLLQGALRLDPNNGSTQQRLREVEATIQVRADQHMAAGQRAFTYLRFDDAIVEWEQVMSMVPTTDPRYQQAAAGVRRARERLGR